MLRLFLRAARETFHPVSFIVRVPLFLGLLKMDPQIEIGYWAIRGLAAPLRMMCVYKSANFKDVSYNTTQKEDGSWDQDGWFEETKPALRKINPLINLPYVKTSDSEIVAQSNACLLYLSRRLGLSGLTEREQADNEQCLFQVFDLRNDHIALVYTDSELENAESPTAHFDSNKDAYLDSTVVTHYTKFEDWLAAHSGRKFLVKDEPLAADFHLWEMLDQHEALAKFVGKQSLLDRFPELKRYYAEFRALPTLKPYFDSQMSKYPINLPMAAFF
mmetsp:Transcript_10682/g.27759  ORF Transcript_10682/g.27759 Transcript_10682/m.27759 type:complete len:274 (+) Transcript_10682:3-824(+)